MDVDLRAVERTLPFRHLVRELCEVECLCEFSLGLLPPWDLADVLLGPSGEVRLELIEPEVAQPLEHELEVHGELGAELFGSAEGVRVILGEAARSQETVDDA